MAEIGNTLGGRYRLVELLGQGGMATIYRARDSQLEREVAVKVLRSEYGTDPDFLDRFRHEAQAAASLSHPGIVAVYDYGTDPGGPFIVMELVEGLDLATLLKRRGTLPPTQAARVGAEVAHALAAAHGRGLVHRDVKPGNILVTSDNRIKVADFGIARAAADSAITVPGTTLGSIHYFSPEQARGEVATAASDVYSLGIVLYELLTGQRPWTGDSAAAVATARLTGAVPSPRAVNPAVPAELDEIVQRALATEPDERWTSAAEMAVELEQFVATARSAGPSGPPTIAAGVARPNPGASVPYPVDAYAGRSGAPAARPAARRTTVVEEDEEEVEAGAGGNSAWLWISALLALGVLALAAFLLFQFLSSPSTPPASQVTVPNLVGRSFADARTTAEGLGLKVEQVAVEETLDATLVGTVSEQDPLAGTSVDAGTSVKLTIAIGAATTTVPDLFGKSASEAANLIATAQLTIGERTDAFDPVVPLGFVVSQNPGAGAVVAKLTVVDYVVSKGPEPSPSPSPTPEPTPTPTPQPTPPPPPPPTPTPLPTPPPTLPPPPPTDAPLPT